MRSATLFCDIDLEELRMCALYDAKCSGWQSAHLRDHTERDRLFLHMFFTPESGAQCQFCSTRRRGLISHMVRARGFYDPVQRAVITNECTWCRSILSTRLDAQHRTVFAAQAEAMYKPKSSSHCCLLSVRCVNRGSRESKVRVLVSSTS